MTLQSVAWPAPGSTTPGAALSHPAEAAVVLQANRYTVHDQDGNVVALLAEDLGGLGKTVGRQLLKTRRPFTATVFSPDGASCPIHKTLTMCQCSDRVLRLSQAWLLMLPLEYLCQQGLSRDPA